MTTTQDAQDLLRDGNGRFREHRAGDQARWAELMQGQQPHSVVLTCADSRVSPAVLFDAKPGELFVVRVAGNIANTSSIASIEYAVAVLGVRLIVVMAHASCGAVAAAMEGGDAGQNLNHLLEHIKPALDAGGGDVDGTARANARLTADRLVDASEVLRGAVENDGLRIVPAFFDFATGEVEFD